LGNRLLKKSAVIRFLSEFIRVQKLFQDEKNGGAIDMIAPPFSL